MDKALPYLLAGLGGFIGSILRFAMQSLSQKVLPSIFPWGTFAVNILGCLLIGFILGAAEREKLMSQEWRIFLATGVCGGFTTFSAFSWESLNLLKGSEPLTGMIYISLSIILGIAATWLGWYLIRS